MILDTGTVLIDIDKINAIIITKDTGKKFEMGVSVGACWLSTVDDNAKAILKAYKWKHKSYMYDKNLKKIGGK